MLPSPTYTRLLGAVAYLTLAVAARGDVTYSEVQDEEGFTETGVIRMTVTPAAEPVPTFKYRLEARNIDLQPGNAVPFYYRALADLPDIAKRLRDQYGEGFDNWCRPAAGTDSTPLHELPLEKVRNAVDASTGGVVGDQVEMATSRRNCEWDIGLADLRGPDLISIPLAEFQESRELTRMLALRTRLALAERRYDDAIDTMRVNYRVAQDFASAPFLVSGLIGIAEASVTNGTLLELIAAPDSPNVYWALAELPQPLVNLEPAARFEMEFGLRMFPFIHQAESTDHSADEWNRLYTQAVLDLATVGGSDQVFASGPDKVGAGIGATALALVGYPHAKASLIEQGMDRDRVEQMSVGQVMAIYTERNYQRYADDMEKAWYVPFHQMRNFSSDVDRRLSAAGLLSGTVDREVLPIVSLLLPAVQAARTAQVRLERDVAALQVIEALRIHAAANDGKLPNSLDEIVKVPIPHNPATGKPFVYRLDGKTASLSLPESDGIPGYQRRYEIRIAE
jgi:hypothetical protein